MGYHHNAMPGKIQTLLSSVSFSLMPWPLRPLLTTRYEAGYSATMEEKKPVPATNWTISNSTAYHFTD
jgi:hypothetical protein